MVNYDFFPQQMRLFCKDVQFDILSSALPQHPPSLLPTWKLVARVLTELKCPQPLPHLGPKVDFFYLDLFFPSSTFLQFSFLLLTFQLISIDLFNTK